MYLYFFVTCGQLYKIFMNKKSFILIPQGQRIKKYANKTSFTPHFNNKTTSVAEGYTSSGNLIT